MDDFLAQSQSLYALNGPIVDCIEVCRGDAKGTQKCVRRLDQRWDPTLAHCSGAKGLGACEGLAQFEHIR
jgi:hypothetical protein